MTRNRRVSAFGLVLALLLQVSCGIADPTAPTSDQTAQGSDPGFGLGSPMITDLLTCKPQPYVMVTKSIGPKGGRIKVGSHVLNIPAGALASELVITAEQVSGSTNSVRFGPAGVTLAVPAELSMSYENCTMVVLPKLIVHTTESLQVVEALPSTDRFLPNIVAAPIEDFSRYAVAY